MIPVTTVILAGGQGKRMGGDKGLQLLHGRPLIQWVLDSIHSQSSEILISANSSRAEYSAFGYSVIVDRLPEGAGPLAGLQSALLAARQEWVVSVPCDTPFLPEDLVVRLYAAIDDAEAAVAVADGKRQPTIALYRKRVLPRLEAYLDSGGRKVGDWLDMLPAQEACFNDAAGFININTRDELNRL